MCVHAYQTLTVSEFLLYPSRNGHVTENVDNQSGTDHARRERQINFFHKHCNLEKNGLDTCMRYLSSVTSRWLDMYWPSSFVVVVAFHVYG